MGKAGHVNNFTSHKPQLRKAQLLDEGRRAIWPSPPVHRAAAFLARFGSALGSALRLGLGVGLGLRLYFDPTQQRFLARNNVHWRAARPLKDPTGHSVDRPHRER